MGCSTVLTYLARRICQRPCLHTLQQSQRIQIKPNACCNTLCAKHFDRCCSASRVRPCSPNHTLAAGTTALAATKSCARQAGPLSGVLQKCRRSSHPATSQVGPLAVCIATHAANNPRCPPKAGPWAVLVSAHTSEYACARRGLHNACGKKRPAAGRRGSGRSSGSARASSSGSSTRGRGDVAVMRWRPARAATPDASPQATSSCTQATLVNGEARCIPVLTLFLRKRL